MGRLLIALIILVLAAAVVFTQLKQRWERPLSIADSGHELTVAAGDSLATVALKLEREGVLAYPWLLRAYGRWTGLDQQVKRGEYLLPAGTTASSLLALLQSGQVIRYQVTLPEGITLSRALEILATQERLKVELQGVDDERIANISDNIGNPEGLFFPDTYSFEAGDSDWDILQRSYRAMEKALQQEWNTKAENLPYESPYEALIMASIVERETGQPSERSEIAAVFVSRLRKGMRLQTDPTIIYGLGDNFDGNLRRRHLKDESNPYNTYRHGGLPPSPIALPGLAAIRAALHPADTKALYFVARGDGSHQFSNTLAEHEAAVRKYQLRRSKNYRSSPTKN